MKSRFPAEKYVLKGEERRKKMGSNGQTFRSIRFSPQNRARSRKVKVPRLEKSMKKYEIFWRAIETSEIATDRPVDCAAEFTPAKKKRAIHIFQNIKNAHDTLPCVILTQGSGSNRLILRIDHRL